MIMERTKLIRKLKEMNNLEVKNECEFQSREDMKYFYLKW